MAHDFTITFKGVRGSIPVPGPTTLRVGGNSSCVQVNVLDHTVFLDAGTGIVNAGKDLVKNFFANKEKLKQLRATILISHTHHDHVMGLPFFAPLFIADSSLSIFGPSCYAPTGQPNDMKYILQMMMDQMFFPVDFDETSSIKHIGTLQNVDQVWLAEGQDAEHVRGSAAKAASKDKVIVTQYRAYNHPKNGSIVYKLQYAGKSVVYATDLEGYAEGDRRLINFAKGADLLIHDAQYTMEQYTGPMTTQGYGHSTPEMACKVAQEAGVKQLALYHHDPNHDDDMIAKKEEGAKKLFANTITAIEGLTLTI
jgi:ribonuclease BN (tRNA processing enzyme)